VDDASRRNGKTIQDFRLLKGLRQGWLAAQVGCSEEHLRKVEHGRPASRRLLLRLGEFMRASGAGDPARELEQRPALYGLRIEDLDVRMEHRLRAMEWRDRQRGDALLALGGEVRDLQEGMRHEKGERRCG